MSPASYRAAPPRVGDHHSTPRAGPLQIEGPGPGVSPVTSGVTGVRHRAGLWRPGRRTALLPSACSAASAAWIAAAAAPAPRRRRRSRRRPGPPARRRWRRSRPRAPVELVPRRGGVRRDGCRRLLGRCRLGGRLGRGLGLGSPGSTAPSSGAVGPTSTRLGVADVGAGVTAEDLVERLLQRVGEADVVAEGHEDLAQQRVLGAGRTTGRRPAARTAGRRRPAGSAGCR